jgi:hypothetical protein
VAIVNTEAAVEQASASKQKAHTQAALVQEPTKPEVPLGIGAKEVQPEGQLESTAKEAVLVFNRAPLCFGGGGGVAWLFLFAFIKQDISRCRSLQPGRPKELGHDIRARGARRDRDRGAAVYHRAARSTQQRAAPAGGWRLGSGQWVAGGWPAGPT